MQIKTEEEDKILPSFIKYPEVFAHKKSADLEQIWWEKLIDFHGNNLFAFDRTHRLSMQTHTKLKQQVQRIDASEDVLCL